MSDPNILDLDNLLPEVKKIKIHGKLLDCHPLTLKQLVAITELEVQLAKAENAQEMYDEIVEVLSPMVPAIKEDPSVDFNFRQLMAIIQFAQTMSIPQNAPQASKFTPKKKVNSHVS